MHCFVLISPELCRGGARVVRFEAPFSRGPSSGLRASSFRPGPQPGSVRVCGHGPKPRNASTGRASLDSSLSRTPAPDQIPLASPLPPSLNKPYSTLPAPMTIKVGSVEVSAPRPSPLRSGQPNRRPTCRRARPPTPDRPQTSIGPAADQTSLLLSAGWLACTGWRGAPTALRAYGGCAPVCAA